MNLEKAQRMVDDFRRWHSVGEIPEVEAAMVVLDDHIKDLNRMISENRNTHRETIAELRSELKEETESVTQHIKLLGDRTQEVNLLDDRITELEVQRDRLLKAATEMLNLIENSDWEDDDQAPDNADMNRWHGIVQGPIHGG